MRRLYYFKVVAEELHFNRAARILAISQPALTRHMSELEGELGIQLFDRSKRRVALTPAGTELLAGVRKMLEQFEDSTQHAREAQSGRRGNLTIGTVGMLMVRLLPLVIRHHLEKYPDVSVDLSVYRSADALEAVRRQHVHLAFLTGFKPDATLAGKKLWECGSRVVLPADHRLAQESEIRLNDLDGETLFLQSRQAIGHQSVLALCQEQKFIPGTIKEVSPIADLETLFGLVGCGLGITIVPSPFEQIKFPLVVFKPIATTHAIHVSACWLRDESNQLVAQLVESAAAFADR